MSQRHSAESILKRKAAGEELSEEEIRYIVHGVYEKVLAPHQLGAFVMAVFVKGMTAKETAHLTCAMMSFGERFQWNEQPWASLVVDKHSTGGVGDKVSIVLAPMVAVHGVKVPMISGRGLGITGGTTDKLESIPGYCCEFPTEKLKQALEDVGCVIMSQSADVAPVDKVIYATRNETGTVASVPLITASIISKKGIEGLHGLVLDVKFGSASFMKTKAEAHELGVSMRNVCKLLNLKTVILLDRMDCPLGFYVGNALEMYECVRILQGHFLDTDLMEITFEMGAYMLQLAGIVKDRDQGVLLCKESIASGRALATFKQMLRIHGVEDSLVQRLCDPKEVQSESDFLRLLGLSASLVQDLQAPSAGVITHIDAMKVGLFCQGIGATKTHPLDRLDLSSGVHLLKKPGDRVEKGDFWARVFANKSHDQVDWSFMHDALQIGDSFTPKPLIEEVLQ